jgi:hypothetical protein
MDITKSQTAYTARLFVVDKKMFLGGGLLYL